MTDEAEGRKPPAHRRTYGRGMIDGLKLAGIANPGEFMNNARMKQLESGLNGLARKVYAAIPVDRPVSIADVVRLCLESHTKIEFRVAQGCVAALLDKGLVRGVGNDSFQRVLPKPVVVRSTPDLARDAAEMPPGNAERPPEPAPEAPIGTAPIELVLMDRLAKLESRARELASDIGDVAVELDDYLARVKQDHATVTQLKDLLKKL